MAGAKDGVRELGLVGGIGKGLGFQAEAGVLFGKEVSGVELKAWLVGSDVEDAPAAGGLEGGGVAELPVAFAENPAMVVAMAVFQSREIVINPFANQSGRGEIERGPDDRGYFSGRNESGVGGQVGVGLKLELVVENGPGGVTAEIPVDVVDQVDGRGGVAGGGGFEDQFVVFGEPVAHLGGEISRISLVAGIGEKSEADALGSGADDRFSFPEATVEPDGAAVEMAGDSARFVVGGKLVFDAIDRKSVV